MTTIAIIGAGITGLACAGKLAAAGHHAVLFDKGRGIGGRVATRRAAGLQFDHGAQYASTQGDEFAKVLGKLAATGAVAPWIDGGGQTRCVGVPGMSAMAKAMAQGLDVRQNTLVSGLSHNTTGWHLQIAGVVHAAAHVIVTVPAPQLAALLGADHPMIARVAHVRYAPSLTLMAAINGPAPFISHHDPGADLAWIAQDSSKPGRPQQEGTAWVAQASAGFSVDHLEQDNDTIAALMLPLLCDRLGLTRDHVTHAAAHRWRYAHVTQALGQSFLRAGDASLYLGGDWCLGPGIANAWASGVAIADDLLAHLA
ncbi:FAD-dependent oxidoreductase [Yoonia sp.]|uniref:NAD(P)/FAD-dependent oxidoreductase n=1 Tax=Yoonia sp. TaxID=2212373 RepID=UPI001A0A4131|nr:FAD-dependent oxidoreductase [Yoonia sp.]MBE0414214.1 NAD(P)-binding protein [Yoonia sp.]